MNTHTAIPENNRTKTRADAAAENWRAAQARQPARRGLWERWHLGPRLMLVLISFALGGLVVGALSFATMPVVATKIERQFADINGDGAPDFIVSGWVVFGPAPKAPAP